MITWPHEPGITDCFYDRPGIPLPPVNHTRVLSSLPCVTRSRGREKFASGYLPSWHWGVSNIPILNGLLFLFETVVISACIIWWHCFILKWRKSSFIFCASSSNSIKSFGLKQTHIFEFYIFHNGPVHPQKIVFINFYGLNVPRILWPWRRMKSEKWQNKKTLLEHYWFVVTALMGNYYFQ